MASYVVDVVFRKIEVFEYLPKRTFCHITRVSWNHGVELPLWVLPDLMAAFGLATKLAA